MRPIELSDVERAAFLAAVEPLRVEQTKAFFTENPQWRTREAVETLCVEVPRVVRVNLERAAHLAEIAQWLAADVGDEFSAARAARAGANALHYLGETARSQVLYEEALKRFVRLGEESEAAITRSSSLLNLAYLGEYDLVFDWEEAARETFERLGDGLRLAILEHNVGNILYRQDRYEEALERYQFAYEEFRKLERAENVAICLRNIAVCHISLHQFEEAGSVYERSRAFCEEHGLARLVLEVDYNIAYLYFLRGEYARSIQLFRTARRQCEAVGDDYHKALCDLDQSEIYLELNLVDEAAKLAESAYTGFSALQMPYETAKALTFQALAVGRLGKSEQALELLRQAQEIFVREGNSLWPAWIDFYQGVVLFREGQPSAAVKLASAALESFEALGDDQRAAMCLVLLAELQQVLGKLEPARARCYDALMRLMELSLPALAHRAYRLMGEIEEARGDRKTALEAYRQSLSVLEKISSQIKGEDLKIAYLKDKNVVYESLVWLTLRDGVPGSRKELCFDYIERAKSRSLMDLMAFQAQTLRPRVPQKDAAEAERIRVLREELNWFYRQMDRHENRDGERSIEEIRRMREKARRKEDELLRSVRELRTEDAEFNALQSGGVVPLETIRGSLPPDTTLVEYFIARGRLFVCVVDPERLEIVELGESRKVRETHRLLQFQLTKMKPGPGRIEALRMLVQQATEAHLLTLYEALIGPIRDLLRTSRLIFVPHGFLHYLPLHALWDGEAYLVDRFTISYAPSAGVFHLCASKKITHENRSLVLGVSDERAPYILDEAKAVAAVLPSATLLLGEEASEEALGRLSPGCRFVHIATHGLFRRDNPMFSAIQLGTTRVHLFDLYELHLDAELAVLSGCGTGLNAVLGVDELVGLTRGLLYAGAQSVLVTLWDVHDVSATLFMSRFYHHLVDGLERSEALRRAMHDLREQYPHPYHWAPFVLLGKPS